MKCLATLRPEKVEAALPVVTFFESVRRERRVTPEGSLNARHANGRLPHAGAEFLRVNPACRVSDVFFPRRAFSYDRGSCSRRRSEIEKEKTTRSEDVERNEKFIDESPQKRTSTRT